MSDDTKDLHDTEAPARPAEAGHSVLEFVESRTGDAPRVTLRDEDSATMSSPVIDPSSEEKFSLPKGRGTYNLMGEIARGGMGVILKGHDTDLGRDVAMKVLSKHLAERPEVVQRFVEEAQIGGQLQHPGIVPVYELGLMADERPYFTMKLVKGRTLATLLAERESPSSNRRHLIDVFESVCQTMAYAHSRGVIHRDLKPANIMVGAFGEVQVVDWGLAKVLARGGTADEKRAREMHSQMTVLETVRSTEGSGSGSDSMVGSVMGTPAYMPPEQASGLVDRLDERSDVFSLGAILCEILTGLPPYTGDRGEIIAAAAQAEYDEGMARLDACQADPELIKLAKQCLLAAPAARPTNAGVVADRVHQHVVTVEERAHVAQVEAAEGRVRIEHERKARKLTVALAVSVLGIGVAGGGGWLFVQNERAAADRVEAARLREDAERDQELAADVNAGLNQASLLQGQEHWGDAILAAERARAMAEGGDASEELLGRVDATLAGLRSAEAAGRRRDELARDTELLLAELQEVREPEWGQDSVQAAEKAFTETFLRHGIDLDEGDAESAAELLLARGLSSETALVLDSWSEVRQRANDEPGGLRLLEIAHLVDPDEMRANLREAVNNKDLDVLLWIVEQGFDDQPAITIELLANALKRLKDRETAWSVYRRGIELYPDDFALHYRLGRHLTPGERASDGPVEEMREAVASYRAALALQPDSIVVRYYLGRVYFRLGELEKAVDQYTICLERRPDEGTFLFHQGMAHRELGRNERAIQYFRVAIDKTPIGWCGPWSLARIGSVLGAQGRVDEAAEYYERALERAPRERIFHSEVSMLLLENGRHEEATRALMRAERTYPNNAEFQNNLAWSLATAEREDARDPVEAIRRAERAVELEPTEANNYNTLGVARYMAGDMEGALRDLTRSCDLSGGGQIADWLFLAMANHRLGNARDAARWYERSVLWMELNPEPDPQIHRFRADADAYLR